MAVTGLAALTAVEGGLGAAGTAVGAGLGDLAGRRWISEPRAPRSRCGRGRRS